MGALLNSFDPNKVGVVAAPPPQQTDASGQPVDASGQPIDIGTQRDPSWKPSGNWVRDLFTRPLAKSESAGEAARDYGLSAADAASFGQVSRVVPQSLIDQAHQNLGPMDYVAQGVGYGIGPGKIFSPLARGAVGATRLAEGASIGARIGGSMAAGGLEGATAGGLGAAGHGGSAGDIVKGTLIGGAGGAAAGVTGGMGPKPAVPEVGSPGTGTIAPTGMYAAKNAEYAPLDSIAFKGKDYQTPLTDVWNNLIKTRNPQRLPGVSLGVSPEINSVVRDIANQPFASGRNLQVASRALRDTGDPIGHRFADALDSTLAKAQPTPGSVFKGAPAQAGDASTAQALGNVWHSKIRDLERLGTDPSQLTNANIKATQAWHAPESVQGQGLTALAKANQPVSNWYRMRHVLAPMAFEGAALGDEALDPENTQPWIRPALHTAAAASLFEGLPALTGAHPTSALNEARYRIATGQPPSTSTGRVGDYLVNALYGRLAGGQ